jgi:class 3 adenylate cyclase
MQDDPLARARAALSRGDVLIAYDEAVTALEARPEDVEARFLAALALARAGAAERARDAAIQLMRCFKEGNGLSTRLREDVEALVARLAKDDALATSGAEQRGRLERAAELYEAVAKRYGGYYSYINAATLRLLSGDALGARRLAEHARMLVAADDDDTADSYWRCATEAEAALILGDDRGARDAIVRAADASGSDLAARAVSCRQLRLVCAAAATDGGILAPLAPPSVLHYCGHRIDASGGPGRFPATLEHQVAEQVRDFLGNRDIGFGYGSLASGADILVAEGLLSDGAELHVVLPFGQDEFERTSVAPAGSAWSSRFAACLDQATSVTYASDSAYLGHEELFGYAARIAMGHALNRAQVLNAHVEQLAVWDGAPATGVAGTSHDVHVWRGTGRSAHVIPVPAHTQSTASTSPPEHAITREVRAIIFTDLRGFSRLRDEHFPVFVHQVLGLLGRVLDKHSHAILSRNSWGDAVAAVCADVVVAAECALGFQDALATLDLAAVGLPHDLGQRIGGHAGPVMPIIDPIRREVTYWGRELTRAARIEPRTPEGEVYVTDAFAALLALERNAPFITEYVGRVTTAKDFETIPMYRLRRKHGRSQSTTDAPSASRRVE